MINGANLTRLPILSPQNVEIDLQTKKKIININNCKPKLNSIKNPGEIIRTETTITKSGRESKPRFKHF